MNCKKLIYVIGAFVTSIMVQAQPDKPWNNPRVNADNRLDNVATYFAYENEQVAQTGKKERSTRFLSIEGNWKFNWARNANERPAGFYALDYDDSKWGTMPVSQKRKSHGIKMRNILNRILCRFTQ